MNDAADLQPSSSGRARALMVLGTASHVGKSLITAAFCRLLADHGYSVAPFKAQNMALNSFVTRDGGEIGRAQVVQAEAAGIEPATEMNPVLLKPMGGVSQVVLNGAPYGVFSARDYYAEKATIWPEIKQAYDRLASKYEIIVLEGAGSPVEINLTEHDLTNLRAARHADAKVILVADIERGGVFAQIIGTWELLEEADRERVIGFVINKFRGDASLLDPGLEFVKRRTGRPVLGVLPFQNDLQIDQEDSLGLGATATSAADHFRDQFSSSTELDIAVIQLPYISNFTDFFTLSRIPSVRVRYVTKPSELGNPSLIVIPGTKATVLDLEWLCECGLADAICSRHKSSNDMMILGICGGFQILGDLIEDPDQVESNRAETTGLGLLPVRTRFLPDKQRHRVTGQTSQGTARIVGYEIHMGETRRAPGVPHWLELIRERDQTKVLDGAIDAQGRVFGTYVHGLFDSLSFTSDFVAQLHARCGLPPLLNSVWEAHQASRADRYRPLATLLREHLDLEPVWQALGIATELTRDRS